MIIRSKAPLRIGLAGGGTDLPSYSEENTGYVLNTTINMYVHTSILPNPNGDIEFFSQDLQQGNKYLTQREIKFDGHLDIYKAVYNKIIDCFGLSPISFKLITFSEAPAGSGLGGSSTLIVSILKAFDELFSLKLNKNDLACLAYQIERVDLGFSGGQQDQYAATFGGFNLMKFSKGLTVKVSSLKLKNWFVNEFEASSFICFSGISRDSSNIIENQNKGIISGKELVLNELHKLKKYALKMREDMLKGNIENVINSIKVSWVSKKKTSSSITNHHIEKIIKKAEYLGVESYKVSGAGGGGFIFFMINPTQKHLAMKELLKLDIDVRNVSYENKGCQSWKIK